MVLIASEESAVPDRERIEAVDPLHHAVHVTLAIYLMPVIAIVCAIGCASILFDRASRLATRLGSEWSGDVKPSRLPGPRLGFRPIIARERRRTRVGR